MYGASVNFCTTVVDVNSKVFTTFVVSFTAFDMLII